MPKMILWMGGKDHDPGSDRCADVAGDGSHRYAQGLHVMILARERFELSTAPGDWPQYRWEGEPLTKERFDAATPVTLEQLNAFCDAVQPRTETPTRPEIPKAREHINRFRICAALFNHFGDDAKEYARKWRMEVEAPSYNEANFEKMWASASTPYIGPKVGLGTLVRWAREGGWQGRLAPEWVHFTGDAKSPKPRTASP